MVKFGTGFDLLFLFLQAIIFWLAFVWLSNGKWKLLLLSFFSVPFIILLNLFIGIWAYPLLIVIFFLFFRRQTAAGGLFIHLLTSLALILVSSFLSAFLFSLTFADQKLTELQDAVISNLLFLLIAAFLFLLTDQVKKQLFWDQLTYQFIYLFLVFLDIVMLFYHTFSVPLQLNIRHIRTLLFLFLLQFFFFSGLFLYHQAKRKKEFEAKLHQQQLLDLQQYTNQLDYSRWELEKFRHDHQNVLQRLKKIAVNEGPQALQQYINQVQIKESNNRASRYADLNNVQQPILKSLLLSKFLYWKQRGIYYSFECKTPITMLPIDEFDFVQLLTFYLDKALEAAALLPAGKGHISVFLYQEPGQLECLIENNFDTAHLSSETFSDKKLMDALSGSAGSAFVESLTKKYPFLLIQQKQTNQLQHIQLLFIH